MKTERPQPKLELQKSKKRQVEACFDGGSISSDGGLLLFHELEQRRGLLRQFAQCFTDLRDPSRIEHSVQELLSQRVLGLVAGYEDLNDHDALRGDPLLAMACGKQDPLGRNRKRAEDKGKALASSSTLNRLELTPKDAQGSSRYKKVVYDENAIANFFVDVLLDSYAKEPSELVLDLDATDDLVHGKQEGRFFHGYYRSYCFLPLYIFCGDHILCAKLRSANRDASAGALEEVERIVARIRERWPSVRIILRADSGFARDALMHWCEENSVHYVFGLARNSRLEAALRPALDEARSRSQKAKRSIRIFRELQYRTRSSWSCTRRVIGKAEYIGKENPRFIVTSLPLGTVKGHALYERVYCARGDMENRIKEQQLGLFADRTSAHEMRANQLRLWFSSVAYVLVNTLRHAGLCGTTMERAQVTTIRSRLIKIGAAVVVSTRRIFVRMCAFFPQKALFAQALRNLGQCLPGST